MRATIVRRTRGIECDAYGNPVDVEVASEVQCYLYQTMRSEREIRADISDETWSVYFPAGTLVAAGDAVIHGSLLYEIVGPPWHAMKPGSTEEVYVTAYMRRAE